MAFKSEQNDRGWLTHAAREVAGILKNRDVSQITTTLAFYERCLNEPVSLHVPLSEEEEELIKRLAGEERIKNTILLKTEAIIFAPSPSGSFDYGTAIHRRFFVRDAWFSIIALNEAFLASASEIMLRYVLEHELIQGDLYKELAKRGLKSINTDIKGLIDEETRQEAIQHTGITEEELEAEWKLILELVNKCPLVPTHFASAALFTYIDRNRERLKEYGLPSSDDIDEELSKADFKAWSLDSFKLFGLFLKELKKELTMTGAEYGAGIL